MRQAQLSNFGHIGFSDLAVHGGPTTCSLATNTPPSRLGVCCLSNVMETWPPESRLRVRSSVCTPPCPSCCSSISWGNITSLSSLLESVGTNSLLALPLSPSLLRSPCKPKFIEEATSLANNWFKQASTANKLNLKEYKYVTKKLKQVEMDHWGKSHLNGNPPFCIKPDHPALLLPIYYGSQQTKGYQYGRWW